MKIPSHIKAVIFDMDGLIIDSEPYWDKALIEMFHKRGRDCPQQALRDVHGSGPKESAQLLKDRYQMDEDVTALISEKKEIFYKLFLKNTKVLPGAREIINKLYKLKYPLAIATMGHYVDKLDLILTKLQLTKFFAVLVTSDEVKNGKPHPDVYLYTAQELGLQANDCLVFEDAPNGVKAGKAAGMTVYGVNKDEEIYLRLKEAGADEVFRSLKEITV